MNLLCRVGIHTPTYRDDPHHDAWTARTWRFMNTCARCGTPLDRTHRR